MSQTTDIKEIIEKCHINDPLQLKKIIEGVMSLARQAPTVSKTILLASDIEEDFYTAASNLYESGRYEEAIEIFEKLIMLDILSYRYTLGLGACYHQMNQHAKALPYYLFASINNPSSPEPSFFAAECCLELDKKKAALFFFEETLQKIGEKKDFLQLKERAELLIPALKK